MYVLAWVEQSGFALRLDSLITAEPWLSRVDSLLLLGTALGVKGQDLAPQACERLAGATAMLGERRARVRLIVDGGIRLQTVPLLRRADADVIVPGSLVFQLEDLAETFSWLHALRDSSFLRHECSATRHLGFQLD